MTNVHYLTVKQEQPRKSFPELEARFDGTEPDEILRLENLASQIVDERTLSTWKIALRAVPDGGTFPVVELARAFHHILTNGGPELLSDSLMIREVLQWSENAPANALDVLAQVRAFFEGFRHRPLGGLAE